MACDEDLRYFSIAFIVLLLEEGFNILDICVERFLEGKHNKSHKRWKIQILTWKYKFYFFLSSPKKEPNGKPQGMKPFVDSLLRLGSDVQVCLIWLLIGILWCVSYYWEGCRLVVGNLSQNFIEFSLKTRSYKTKSLRKTSVKFPSLLFQRKIKLTRNKKKKTFNCSYRIFPI